MSDLRELGRELVENPLLPAPSLESLRQRAVRTRRRRRGTVAAPFAGLLLAAALVVTRAGEDSPGAIRTIERAPASELEAPPPASEERTATEPSSRIRSESAPAGRADQSPQAVATATTTPAAPARPVIAPGPYDDMRGRPADRSGECHLEGSWHAKRSSQSDYPSCTFVATEALGFAAYGEWWMTVERPDGTIRGYCHREPRPDRDTDYSVRCEVYDPREGNPHLVNPVRSCGPIGFIQPGDRVSAWLHDGGHANHAADHGEAPTFKASRTHHC